jgi:hypothetical protein
MINNDNGFGAEKIAPSYELSDAKIHLLTSELLSERASDMPIDIPVAVIEVNGNSKFANIGRQIERSVFEARFGNDAKQMQKEYGPYESASRFFISVNRDTEEATGVLRVIENSSNGLKTLNDIQNDPFSISLDTFIKKHNISDLDKVWDIGTVASLSSSKAEGLLSSIKLYRAMYLSAHGDDSETSNNGNSIEHIVSIVDSKLIRMLERYLLIPFEPLAGSEPMPYLGSKSSQAVYGHVAEFKHIVGEKMSSGQLVIKDSLKGLFDGDDDESIVLLQNK